MRDLFRRPTARLCALLAVALVLASGVAAQPIPAAAAGAATPRAATVPSLPAAVVAAAEHTPGMVVRRAPGLVVRAITVPPAVRAADPSVPANVWRVRVAGRFPPRALRYIVSAGGHAVGYGTPSFHMNAAVAVTADPAVVTDAVTARYEGADEAAVPGTAGDAPTAAQAARSLAARLGDGAHPTLDVARRLYSLGDQAYQPPGIQGKVELAGDVHYPKDLTQGPYPLVLFLHGNHASCYKGDKAGYRWPCPPGWTPMPNDIGYDYMAERLASYGYIVVSVSGNGVNVLGNQLPDTGMRQRGYLLRRHLDLWHKWSTIGHGPFGTRFVGAVDMSRIGVMGHSRGGEGAIRLVIVDRKSRRPVRDRRGAAARAGRLRPEDGERHPDGGHPPVLRRRRVRPGGHALLRRRALPQAGRPDAQGDRHRHGRQPQLLQHGVDAELRLPRRVRRRPGGMSRTHLLEGAADGRTRVRRATSSGGTSEGRSRWTTSGRAPGRRPRSPPCRRSSRTWRRTSRISGRIWTGSRTPGHGSRGRARR